MNALDVLGELYSRGVRLRIAGDSIHLRAPAGVLTATLQLCVKQHKEPIVELLGPGEYPDETLPSMIRVPTDLPNTVKAIQECIDGQRLGRSAA